MSEYCNEMIWSNWISSGTCVSLHMCSPHCLIQSKLPQCKHRTPLFVSSSFQSSAAASSSVSGWHGFQWAETHGSGTYLDFHQCCGCQVAAILSFGPGFLFPGCQGRLGSAQWQTMKSSSGMRLWLWMLKHQPVLQGQSPKLKLAWFDGFDPSFSCQILLFQHFLGEFWLFMLFFVSEFPSMDCYPWMQCFHPSSQCLPSEACLEQTGLSPSLSFGAWWAQCSMGWVL